MNVRNRDNLSLSINKNFDLTGHKSGPLFSRVVLQLCSLNGKYFLMKSHNEI